MIIEGPMVIPNVRNVAERNLRAVGAGNQDIAERFDIFAEISRIPHADGEALASFNRGRHVLPANRRLNHVLNVADINAVARGSRPIDANFEIRSAGNSLRIEIRPRRAHRAERVRSRRISFR